MAGWRAPPPAPRLQHLAAHCGARRHQPPGRRAAARLPTAPSRRGRAVMLRRQAPQPVRLARALR
jgi:hypothetical protein